MRFINSDVTDLRLLLKHDDGSGQPSQKKQKNDKKRKKKTK